MGYELSIESGKTKGLLGFAIVQVGGKLGVKVLDLMEKPGMKPDGVLCVKFAI